MSDAIQNILRAIETARAAGELNNDAARAASIALGLEGDDAMLANRLIAQGSDPASLEYVATGAVSPPVALAHRQGPGSLEGEDRRSWLLLAALSTDESKDATLRERVLQFAEATSRLRWVLEEEEREELIAAQEQKIRSLPHKLISIGGAFLPTYRADLGFAAAYWNGAKAAAVIGVSNGEPYIAVGSNGTPLADLGITVDKLIAPCFGIIEDPDEVKRISEVFDIPSCPDGCAGTDCHCQNCGEPGAVMDEHGTCALCFGVCEVCGKESELVPDVGPEQCICYTCATVV